jgi:putative ABC transport system ATP-binding protein
MTVALRAEHLTRTFPSPAGDVHACEDIDLELHAGELLVVRGASGAGKTTLLNLLGVLDRPTSGRVLIGEVDTTGRSESELALLRRENLGFVFQSFGLIPVLSARENVELPLRIAAVDPQERAERVAVTLELVGLAAHAEQRPAELSGGQQQRVAIARAIVKRPRVLLADEPTGNLDESMRDEILTLLQGLCAEGITMIVVTHDSAVARRATRRLRLAKGTVQDITR